LMNSVCYSNDAIPDHYIWTTITVNCMCFSLRCLWKTLVLSFELAPVQHRCQKLVDQLCPLVHRGRTALVPSLRMYWMYYLMNQIFQKVGWCCMVS